MKLVDVALECRSYSKVELENNVTYRVYTLETIGRESKREGMRKLSEMGSYQGLKNNSPLPRPT
jgi:hypothetical protein